MTSPTFQIGDFVAVKENSCLQFRITWICQEEDGTINYSTEGIGWYPASSLQLVEPELKVGDYAEVILPNNSFTGKIGQVSGIGELTVALYDMGIWERGSLRRLSPAEVDKHLESELKIGDWVEVIGPCGDEYVARDDDPIVFRISEIRDRAERTYRDRKSGRPGYIANNLRKLTPEEALCYITKRPSECIDASLEERISAIEKRLDFVEKFQRGQAEAAQYRRNMYRR